MLELMRRHAKSWIMKLLLFLIIIVFALYFGSMGGRKTAEAVATVDGKPIAYVEFQKEYQDLIEVMQHRFKGALTDELIKSLNLKQQALDNLIDRAVIIRKADDMGITVTKEEVRNSILSFPGFQRDGVFKEYLYQDLLRMNHMTPEEFELSHKKNILVEKVRELVQNGVFVTDPEVYELYQMRNEKINIQFVKIASSEIVKDIAPSTEDLENFLKQNGAKFRIPEQVQFKYLAFPAADAASEITLSDSEIADYVDRQKDTWGKNNPRLTDAAMKNMAISELKQIQGMQAAAKNAKTAHDTIYQEENFDDFALQHHYKIQKTDFFPLNKPPQKFANINDFTKKLLDLQKDEVSRVLSDESGYYVFQLIEKKPSRIPPLKDVEQTVRSLYLAERSRQMAIDAAQAMLDRLRKGESWQKVAAEKKLRISETGLFLPGEAIPKIGNSPEISDSLLALGANAPYPETPFVIEGNAYVIRFLARDKIDPADYETRKANLKQALLRFKQDNVIRSWLEATKVAMIKDGRLKLNKDVKDL
ncbi:MAG: SurA N-terminal domain-containing protein [Syntrophaceae bacterium]|nr:SurA N-terminal domain-containing protein [Syntrophaceae bacterium]